MKRIVIMLVVTVLFLSSCVAKKKYRREMAVLSAEIGRLTVQLERGQKDLVEANGKLDDAASKIIYQNHALRTQQDYIETQHDLIKVQENAIQFKDDLIKRKEQKLKTLTKQHSELKNELSEEVKRNEIRIKYENESIIVTMHDKILFDTGRAVLKREATEALDKIADILNKYENTYVIVEGHTDNVPISNSVYPSNWHLSTARSLVVTNYLIKIKEVNPERIKVIGRGEYYPVDTNETISGRSHNRRVDIIIMTR